MRAITRTWLTPEQRARHAAYQREWRAENYERSNEIARESRQRWRDANPERAKAVQAENRYRVRRQVLELLGGVLCAHCGFNDWRALQVDHRNGGGHEEQRQTGSSLTAASDIWKFRSIILENPEAARAKYQVLCANCNWIKRHENNECGTAE